MVRISGTLVIHQKSVFKMSRRHSIDRQSRPTILGHPNLRVAHVHHGFDANRHALAKLWSGSGFSKVWDLRIFMQGTTHAVAHEIGDHRETGCLDMLLYRFRDVSHSVLMQSLSHALEKRFLRDFEKLFDFGTDPPHPNGPAIVSDHPILPNANVHRDHVPILQNPSSTPIPWTTSSFTEKASVGRENAMAGTVALACAFHSHVLHQLPARLIHLKRTHTRSDQRAEAVQNGGGGVSGPTHPFFFLKTFANHVSYIGENKSAFNHKAPNPQFFRIHSAPQQEHNQGSQNQLDEMQ